MNWTRVAKAGCGGQRVGRGWRGRRVDKGQMVLDLIWPVLVFRSFLFQGNLFSLASLSWFRIWLKTRKGVYPNE